MTLMSITRSINGGFPDENGNVTIPTASTSTLGRVMVDGTTITIDENGKISSVGGSSVDEFIEIEPKTMYNLTNSYPNGKTKFTIEFQAESDPSGYRSACGYSDLDESYYPYTCTVYTNKVVGGFVNQIAVVYSEKLMKVVGTLNRGNTTIGSAYFAPAYPEHVVVSVNGNKADNTGNITISTTGYIPWRLKETERYIEVNENFETVPVYYQTYTHDTTSVTLFINGIPQPPSKFQVSSSNFEMFNVTIHEPPTIPYVAELVILSVSDSYP